MATVLLILGLILFVGLVIIHELGHFWAARRNGVEVEEFGIGFPPRAKVLGKRNGTTYTLNWLPIGGFVRLKGEHDDDKTTGGYGSAPLFAKIKILLAGVAMNFVAAFFIFTILAFIGLPKADLKNLPFYDKDQFTVASDTEVISNRIFVSVVPNSPAAAAGLKNGDQIISLSDITVESANQLPAITSELRGQEVDIKYKSDSRDETLSARVLLNDEHDENTGFLGVSPVDSQIIRATWSAPIVGLATTWQYTDVSFRGLGYIMQNLFAGRASEASDAVGGPVATFKILSDTSTLGLSPVLFIIGLIAVSLAVMNVLPIPALDGGRLFVTLLFRALKRPLTKKTEDIIHGSGFALLMGLILLITIIDIRRFF